MQTSIECEVVSERKSKRDSDVLGLARNVVVRGESAVVSKMWKAREGQVHHADEMDEMDEETKHTTWHKDGIVIMR